MNSRKRLNYWEILKGIMTHYKSVYRNTFANYTVLVIQVLIECVLNYLKKSTKKIMKLFIYPNCHHAAVLLDFTFTSHLRANTIAYLWKQSQNAVIDVPDITTNGWIK